MDLNEEVPYLYHYYERNTGPLKNLSELDSNDAERIFKKLQKENTTFAAKRPANYLIIRRELEEKIRELFINKGGEPKKGFPHYFIFGECPWVKEWFQDGMEVKIPLKKFDPKTISFTYGDSFPAMRFQDGKPYRGQVYTLEEISKIIKLYGLPQEWNKDGKYGPERYIEVQVWDDEPLLLNGG
ncbi:hypothetical protein [Halalkalibacter sp. APA_J-10(15)]|uniref:hypothetical protein n=1 Tax=unclassified Halalkalibacter TaxID=2893063 RepID=UPI001FF459BF|nr:hypothetical protein [Halalkalibacter sp. APA_J-10(15)]MCK0473177.1 hypothetical protein [Halalkalibacter sp. APA_J-10(15)]